MSESALIFGAGKIGRGFLAHLLSRSGYAITFIEAVSANAAALRHAGRYELHVLGAPEKNTTIQGFDVIDAADATAVHEAVASHRLIFTAAGAANLQQVGKSLAAGFNHAHAHGRLTADRNIIICENDKRPAATLRQCIESHLNEAALAWSREHLGIAETQVLRSCIEPTDEQREKSPWSLQVQDWWVLPCDADALRGQPPVFEGLSLKKNFQNELLRKLYTYNCSNAVIGYLGHLKGHTMLHEAANDAQVLAIARQAYAETGEALVREFGFDRDEHRKLQDMALAKYQDTRIADPIERNCRDSRRKLSADDRLLGPALLAHAHGVSPEAVCLAAAAALHYDGSNDAGTRHVRQLMKEKGALATITETCGLQADHPLTQLILQGEKKLTQMGLLPEKHVKSSAARQSS